jgi:hypothetical protein
MPSKEPAWNENDGKLQRVLHVLVLALTFMDHEDGPLGGPVAQRGWACCPACWMYRGRHGV